MSLPQLRMEKNDLDRVPKLPVPETYLLRNYREGDEAGMARVYLAAQLSDGAVESVRRGILEHDCFSPERVFIVEHAGEVVGTSAAWLEPEKDPGFCYLHMVGVLPEHQGKRLGAILSVVSIRYAHREGFKEQRLLTDDFRGAAVRLYLDLGYYPLLSHESHLERWQALAEQLHRPQALARARNLMA